MKSSKTLEFRYALAKTIKNYRTSVNINQEELAKRCEVTQACVSQWETAVRLPSIFEFYKLRYALGIAGGDSVFWKELEENMPEA